MVRAQRTPLPRSRWSTALVLLGGITAIASSAQPLLIAGFIDGILKSRPVLFLFLGLAGAIAVVLVSELLSKLAWASAVQDLRDRWRSLLLDLALAHGGAPDDLASHSNNDVEEVIESLHLGRVQLILSLVSLGVAGAGLTLISPIFLALIAMTAAVMLLVPLVLRRRIARRKAHALSRTAIWNAGLIQTAQSLPLLRRRRVVEIRRRWLEMVSRDATASQRSAESFEGMIDVAVGGVLFLNQLLIIFVGWQLIEHGTITVGALVAALQFEDLVLTPMLSITDSMTTIAGGKEIAQELTSSSAEGSDRDDLPIITHGAQQLEVRAGTLPLGPDRFLHVPDLVVGRTDRIVICGASGAGKSTLARLLAGELAPNDRSDRSALDVAYLPAEEPAFDADVIYDVTLGRAVDPSVLDRVLDGVGSGTGRLEEMRESGTSEGASLGERQRINLARVLIDPPDVLVLDEALGHLDGETAASMFAAIPELTGAEIGLVVVRDDPPSPGENWTQAWHVAGDRVRVAAPPPASVTEWRMGEAPSM